MFSDYEILCQIDVIIERLLLMQQFPINRYIDFDDLPHYNCKTVYIHRFIEFLQSILG